MGVTRVTIWVIGVSNLLTMSARPSKCNLGFRGFTQCSFLGQVMASESYALGFRPRGVLRFQRLRFRVSGFSVWLQVSKVRLRFSKVCIWIGG